MPFSTRPDSLDERLAILSAIMKYRAAPTANAAVLVLEQTLFAPVATAWKDASDQHSALQGAARNASATTDASGWVLGAAFRNWLGSVTGTDGRVPTAGLAALMDGVRPGKMIQKKPRERAALARKLLAKVDERTLLQGNPVLRQALDAALVDFENLVSLDEAATRAQFSQGQTVKRLTPAFDAAYGELVKSFRRILGDETTWRILPRFIRRNGSDKGLPEGFDSALTDVPPASVPPASVEPTANPVVAPESVDSAREVA